MPGGCRPGGQGAVLRGPAAKCGGNAYPAQEALRRVLRAPEPGTPSQVAEGCSALPSPRPSAWLPRPPGPARPGGVSLHSPALSCFPQFSLFLISSLGKNSVQLHESPEMLLGRRQVINQEARTPRSQSRALLLAVMKSTTRARRVGRRDSAALSTLAGSCSRRHPVCRMFHLP